MRPELLSRGRGIGVNAGCLRSLTWTHKGDVCVSRCSIGTEIEPRFPFHGLSPRIGPAEVRSRIEPADGLAYSVSEKPHTGVSTRISTPTSRSRAESRSRWPSLLDRWASAYTTVS